MVTLENHLGTIRVSHSFLVDLVGRAVVSCFGVAGMAVTPAQKSPLAKLYRSKTDALDRGIRVRSKDDGLLIDLHIIVLYGTNISAIVKSIINKVTYTVEDTTGIRVLRVNVDVDGLKQ